MVLYYHVMVYALQFKGPTNKQEYPYAQRDDP